MEFLGIMPGYNRIRHLCLVCSSFLAFFFAMIFGDGGYGAIIALIATAGIVSSRKGGKKVRRSGSCFYTSAR
jgi:V/A-type H+-transporting ATPase subunit I